MKKKKKDEWNGIGVISTRRQGGNKFVSVGLAKKKKKKNFSQTYNNIWYYIPRSIKGNSIQERRKGLMMIVYSLIESVGKFSIWNYIKIGVTRMNCYIIVILVNWIYFIIISYGVNWKT